MPGTSAPPGAVGRTNNFFATPYVYQNPDSELFQRSLNSFFYSARNHKNES